MADEAMAWTGKELERFRDYLAQTSSEAAGSVPVLQEGGELTGHPLREMSQDAWKGFQEKFLEMEA